MTFGIHILDPDIRPTFLLSELLYNTSVADVHLISVSYSSMYKVGTLKFRNWVTYTTGHSYKHWFTLTNSISAYIDYLLEHEP